LGCCGLTAIALVVLWVAQRFGLWAGAAALVLLIVAAHRMSRLGRLAQGLLLGAFFAWGVWTFMARDYATLTGWRIANASLAFLAFTMAGRWMQKHRDR
jgi:hypothetical protein